MKVQVLSQGKVSSLASIDGVVVAARSDGKHFSTAIDGGLIRKYPINVDDLKHTTDDVFTLKQSRITCVDSTRDTGAPNTFIIRCTDGNLHLCSRNRRVKKSVPAHTGGVICVSVNLEGPLIASGAEDGIVKMRSWNGILRMNFASVGGAVTSWNWDNTRKDLMFTYDWTATVRSASFKQDQRQFRAHRHLVACSVWSRTSGELITGGRIRSRAFDADGRVLADSAARDFAVLSIVSLSLAKLCFIGTVNRFSVTDNRPHLLNMITVAAGATICLSPDQPRVIVAGNRPAALITVGSK
jgi:intraflagellar transport protein 80